MLSQVEKSSNYYIFPAGIYKNTYKGIWSDFIKGKGMQKEYLSQKDKYNDYIDFINAKNIEGSITVNEINQILEDALSFGKHRVIQIYDIDINKKYTKDEIINEISKKYSITENYNELARTYEYDENNDLDALAYFKILDIAENDVVNYVRIIMVKKVSYKTNDNKLQSENSYFPIDIDFLNKKILVKYYDKEYMKGDSRGEVLANLYANIIINLFNDIELAVTKQKEYQNALYNICNKILNDVIYERSKIILNNIDEVVNKTSKVLKEGLKKSINIDELLKKHGKNIFNIDEQIYKFIENICISKVIYEASEEDASSVEGLISYITYKEQGQVRTTIKNPNKRENLLDSQSYLNLRAALEDSKHIEIMKMIWNVVSEKDSCKKISVKYDVSKYEYSSIKFYWKYTQEELDYARKQIQQFC